MQVEAFCVKHSTEFFSLWISGSIVIILSRISH